MQVTFTKKVPNWFKKYIVQCNYVFVICFDFCFFFKIYIFSRNQRSWLRTTDRVGKAEIVTKSSIVEFNVIC